MIRAGRQLPFRLGLLAAAGLFVPAGSGAVQWERQSAAITVRAGATSVALDFPVRNDGPSAIKFVQVETSCGCTTVRLDQRELAPGGQTTLHSTVQIATTESGRLEKWIDVTTSDAAGTHQSRLRLTVNVPTVASVRPRVAEWKIGQSPVSQTMDVEVNVPAGVTIAGVRSSSPAVVPSLRAAGTGHYTLTLTPQRTDHAAVARILIEIAVPGSPARTLTVDTAIR